MRTLLLITLLTLTPHGAYSDEPDEASAKAPPKHTLFRHSFGGAYFIPNPLSEEYEELTSRVDKLRESLDTDDSDTANALREVEQLTKSLDELRTKIDKEQKFVYETVMRRSSNMETGMAATLGRLKATLEA